MLALLRHPRESVEGDELDVGVPVAVLDEDNMIGHYAIFFLLILQK